MITFISFRIIFNRFYVRVYLVRYNLNFEKCGLEPNSYAKCLSMKIDELFYLNGLKITFSLHFQLLSLPKFQFCSLFDSGTKITYVLYHSKALNLL